MQCVKCNIKVSGTHKKCPLCGEVLQEGKKGSKDDCSYDIFPRVPLTYRHNRLYLKILALISVLTAVICVTVNISIPQSGFWSLFVLAGLASFWICFSLVIKKMGSIPKSIISQVLIITFLTLAWDLSTGFYRWSINFVIPIICTCALLAIAAVARFLRLQAGDYMIYIVIVSVLGAISLLLIVLGVVTIIIPSAICFATSVILLATLFLFQGRALRSELKRRMHI